MSFRFFGSNAKNSTLIMGSDTYSETIDDNGNRIITYPTSQFDAVSANVEHSTTPLSPTAYKVSDIAFDHVGDTHVLGSHINITIGGTVPAPLHQPDFSQIRHYSSHHRALPPKNTHEVSVIDTARDNFGHTHAIVTPIILTRPSVGVILDNGLKLFTSFAEAVDFVNANFAPETIVPNTPCPGAIIQLAYSKDLVFVDTEGVHDFMNNRYPDLACYETLHQ